LSAISAVIFYILLATGGTLGRRSQNPEVLQFENHSNRLQLRELINIIINIIFLS